MAAEAVATAGTAVVAAVAEIVAEAVAVVEAEDVTADAMVVVAEVAAMADVTVTVVAAEIAGASSSSPFRERRNFKIFSAGARDDGPRRFCFILRR